MRLLNAVLGGGGVGERRRAGCEAKGREEPCPAPPARPRWYMPGAAPLRPTRETPDPQIPSPCGNSLTCSSLKRGDVIGKQVPKWHILCNLVRRSLYSAGPMYAK